MRKSTILKMGRNLAFFIALILVTFFFIFKDQDLGELWEVLKSSNLIYILVAILCMFVYFSMESYNVRRILHVIGERKISFFNAIKYTLIGFFFSAITPCATGGQPMEIYYMNKDGLSIARSTMALLIQLCGYQICTIALAIFGAIANPSLLKGSVLWLLIVGLLINGTVLTVMLICIFSKKLTRKLMNLVIKIVKIFKKKGIEAFKKNLEDGLKKYEDSSEFIHTHKREFIKAILRVLVQAVFYHSVPYLVYRSFGLNALNYFQFLTMQSVLYLTVSGLPIPGAVGASENVFLTIYTAAFGESLLSGAMLLSRGITFYLFVAISAIVVLVNAVAKKKVVSELDEDVEEIEIEKREEKAKKKSAA